MRFNHSNMFITITAAFILSGCKPGAVIVTGEVPQTPAEYVKSVENTKFETRDVSLQFPTVVERLKVVSDQCYQFEVSAKGNGVEVYKDKYTGKVTMLSPESVAFTLQYDRVGGQDLVYRNNDKPDGGMWNFAIVVDKSSSTESTAKLYIPFGLMKKNLNAVVDAVEGKYGKGCPPEKLLF